MTDLDKSLEKPQKARKSPADPAAKPYPSQTGSDLATVEPMAAQTAGDGPAEELGVVADSPVQENALEEPAAGAPSVDVVEESQEPEVAHHVAVQAAAGERKSSAERLRFRRNAHRR